MAEDIWAKRRGALWIIAGFAAGNIVISGAPKPTVEVPAHIVLTGADFVMCGLVYDKYFGEKMGADGVIKLLTDFGIITAAAVGGGYAIAKGASGLVAEFTNFLGPLGWLASGLLAAGGTAMLGVLWLMVVDSGYRNLGGKTLTGGAVKALSN